MWQIRILPELLMLKIKPILAVPGYQHVRSPNFPGKIWGNPVERGDDGQIWKMIEQLNTLISKLWGRGGLDCENLRKLESAKLCSKLLLPLYNGK